MEFLLGLQAHEISTNRSGVVTAVRESGFDVTYPDDVVGTYSWGCADIEVG